MLYGLRQVHIRKKRKAIDYFASERPSVDHHGARGGGRDNLCCHLYDSRGRRRSPQVQASCTPLATCSDRGHLSSSTHTKKNKRKEEDVKNKNRKGEMRWTKKSRVKTTTVIPSLFEPVLETVASRKTEYRLASWAPLMNPSLPSLRGKTSSIYMTARIWEFINNNYDNQIWHCVHGAITKRSIHDTIKISYYSVRRFILCFFLLKRAPFTRTTSLSLHVQNGQQRCSSHRFTTHKNKIGACASHEYIKTAGQKTNHDLVLNVVGLHSNQVIMRRNVQ